MNRNEYRRAFIMLRAAAQGYGGHVRLERRTLTGSMYFIVSAPEGAGPLRAALAGQRDGQYYATPLGTLSRDRRGQVTLAWQFDPRGIDGRPLEAYAWVAVAQTGDACRVVLTGNVEGSRDLDPVQLERAVCALFAPEEAPAADLPERAAEAPAATEETAAPPAQAEETQSDIKIYTGSRARPVTRTPTGDAGIGEAAGAAPAPGGSGASDAAAEPTPAGDRVPPSGTAGPASGEVRATAAAEPTPAGDRVPPSGTAGPASGEVRATAATEPTPARDRVPPSGTAEPASGEVRATVAAEPTPAGDRVPPSGTAEPASGEVRATVAGAPTAAPAEPAAPRTAAQALGLDITRPWPAPAEPLRRLFATQAPAQAAPDGEYVYVVAPMPTSSGYAGSLAGLRAEGGRITGLRYALPARYAPQPPAGLEDYRWLGTGGEGWWVLDMTIE